MDRSELIAAALDEAHRSDLSTQAAGFLRNAEGMIARRLRATEILSTYNITDSDRTGTDEPTFTLPTGFLAARAIWIPTEDGRHVELEAKSLYELRRMSSGAAVSWYAVRGATVEFRGTPGASDVMEMDFYKRPDALVNDTDTNDLLDNHEEIYVSAFLFFLHRHAQDFETAQGYLDSFDAAVKALNEASAHKVGGSSIAPAYNFHFTSSY